MTHLIGDDADPAPARVLPGVPVFRFQPVLDDDPAAARRAALSPDAKRNRAVRASPASPERSPRRSPAGSLIAAGAGPRPSRRSFWCWPPCPSRSFRRRDRRSRFSSLAAVTIDFGVQANLIFGYPGDFLACARGAWTPQRRLSRDVLRRRGGRLGRSARGPLRAGGGRSRAGIGSSPPLLALVRMVVGRRDRKGMSRRPSRTRRPAHNSLTPPSC